jgi:peptidoglycan hydrolase-like protein with peptidoglycan-binding domain
LLCEDAVVRRFLAIAALVTASTLVASPAPAVQSVPAVHSVAKAVCQRTLPSYPVLRPGDRGQAVRTLQCSLNDLDLEVGPVLVDGYYGPETKAAVKEIVDGFEGTHHPHPYRVNNGFWVLIFGRQLPDSNLAIGAHGPVVRVLQRALRAAGATLVVDGDFGSQTEAAVKRYQKAVRVSQSGVVNEKTRFFLKQGAVIGQLN